MIRPTGFGYPSQVALWQASGDAILGRATNAGNPGPLTASAVGTTAMALDTADDTDIDQISAADSNIKIEIALSIHAAAAGTALTAGDTDTVNVKPFLIGTTNAWDNVLAFHDYDVQSFTVINATSDTLGPVDLYESVDTYAHVHTGVINATKTDANGDSLAGAIFALQNNTSSQWVTALTAAAAGPTFTVITPTPLSYAMFTPPSAFRPAWSVLTEPSPATTTNLSRPQPRQTTNSYLPPPGPSSPRFPSRGQISPPRRALLRSPE